MRLLLDGFFTIYGAAKDYFCFSFRVNEAFGITWTGPSIGETWLNLVETAYFIFYI